MSEAITSIEYHYFMKFKDEAREVSITWVWLDPTTHTIPSNIPLEFFVFQIKDEDGRYVLL